MWHIRRVLSTPVTFRLPAIRATTTRLQRKPCRPGDQLPSRASCTRNLKILSLLFGISIMSQAMAVEPVQVDLHQTRAESADDGLGTHDHYRFDQSSGPALSDSSQVSDTLDASPAPPSQPTEVTYAQEPLPQGQALQESPFPPSTPSAHSPRSTRSQSLAASLVSPIRRKPLSPTASPLAVGFSSRSDHTKPQEMQEPEPDSGYYSLDSPDLYDQHSSEGPAPIASPSPLPEVQSELQSEGEEE